MSGALPQANYVTDVREPLSLPHAGFLSRIERATLLRVTVSIANRSYSLFGTTFVHGDHAPSACCWILRFQILLPQKA